MSTAKTEEQKERKRERDRKYRERKRALKAKNSQLHIEKSTATPFAVRIKLLPKKVEPKPVSKAKKPVKTIKMKLVAKKSPPLEKRVAIAAITLRALSTFLAGD